MNGQVLSSSGYGSESLLLLEESRELAIDKLDMNMADFSWYRDDFDNELIPVQGDKPMPVLALNDGLLQCDDPAAYPFPAVVQKQDLLAPTKLAKPPLPAFVRSTSLPRLSAGEKISTCLKRKMEGVTPDLPVSLFNSKRRQSLPAKLTSGTALGSQYQPGSWDVVCGRGRGNFEHVGNRRLRVLISIQLQRYVSAKTRFEKSKVIDLVVEQVLEAAGPVGGFVKRDENGVWFQMTKSLARDKVGHLLRGLAKLDEIKK